MTTKTQVKVSELPQCNFCDSKAKYDCKTKMGAWGYCCEEHFRVYGLGLGLGIGQELVLEEST